MISTLRRKESYGTVHCDSSEMGRWEVREGVYRLLNTIYMLLDFLSLQPGSEATGLFEKLEGWRE